MILSLTAFYQINIQTTFYCIADYSLEVKFKLETKPDAVFGFLNFFFFFKIYSIAGKSTNNYMRDIQIPC